MIDSKLLETLTQAGYEVSVINNDTISLKDRKTKNTANIELLGNSTFRLRFSANKKVFTPADDIILLKYILMYINLNQEFGS